MALQEIRQSAMLETTMNLAVGDSRPMIRCVGRSSLHTNELPINTPAEGPIFGVGLDHSVACAVARSIFASLAAAPLFAAVVGRFANSRQRLSSDMHFGGFFLAQFTIVLNWKQAPKSVSERRLSTLAALAR